MNERPKHLRNLSDAQYAAVTHDPNVPLQILAGPGSGKTRTLTYRIAHLIDIHGVPPSRIVAVTFTNKAASELRVRLDALIGQASSSSLILGTFHSICGRLLRKYGSAIQIPTNFSICDADESKKIINRILKDIVATSGSHASGNQKSELKDSIALELISKAKAKGLNPEELEAKVRRDIQANVTVPKGETNPHVMLQLVPVYSQYIDECKRHNALDFDDLLAYGVKLLKARPDCVDCQHVFVDEFQDTNTVQFELMAKLAGKNGNVSIVGDPDQSIYGWRSAEIENLRRMITIFPLTKQIFLEDNYRSTGAILAASIAIISEDSNRPPKTLRTSHPFGFAPTLGGCADEREEAACIADEIKRLKTLSGGMLKWSDFAVLLRFNALSRNLEQALQKEGIPSRVLAGQKFFDRVEVKDLLAYLQLIDNPEFDPAVLRIINVPKRNIGNKSIEELQKRARHKKEPMMRIVERIVDGRIPDISPPLQSKVKGFVHSLRKLRKFSQQGMSVSCLIQELVTELNYAEHLKKTQQDWETRWENVRELITFATEGTATSDPEVASSLAPQSAEPDSKKDDEGPSIPATPTTDTEQLPEEFEAVPSTVATITATLDAFESDDDDGVDKLFGNEAEIITPLRHFLQTTSLSTDATVNDDDSQGEKVVISTCHAAKGLEWPVVFIPSVEQGTFPFYRSDDIEEERRLLYVACTRAQILLYLTYANKRKLGGETKTTDLSEYLKVVLKKGSKSAFTHTKPTLAHKEFAVLSKVIERDAPDPKSVEEGIQSYYKARPESAHGGSQFTSRQHSSAGLNQPVASEPRVVTHSAVFHTVKSIVGNLPQVQVTRTLQTTNLSSIARVSGQSSKPAVQSTSNVASKGPGMLRGYLQDNGSSQTPKQYQFKKPASSVTNVRSSMQSVPSPEVTKAHIKETPGIMQGSTSTYATSTVVPLVSPRPEQPPAKVAGTKRRLGMTARVSKFPRND